MLKSKTILSRQISAFQDCYVISYASVFPEETGTLVLAAWNRNEWSQGNSSDMQVCSSARCPVSGIRINIWTEKKISLPFVLGRENLVSKNISHLSKWKWTKPKSFIVRWCPTFWNSQSSAVSRHWSFTGGVGKQGAHLRGLSNAYMTKNIRRTLLEQCITCV